MKSTGKNHSGDEKGNILHTAVCTPQSPQHKLYINKFSVPAIISSEMNHSLSPHLRKIKINHPEKDTLESLHKCPSYPCFQSKRWRAWPWCGTACNFLQLWDPSISWLFDTRMTSLGSGRWATWPIWSPQAQIPHPSVHSGRRGSLRTGDRTRPLFPLPPTRPYTQPRFIWKTEKGCGTTMMTTKNVIT